VTSSSRTVVVSGASRGLGRVLAAAFGAQGDFVFVGYLANLEAAQQSLDAVKSAGGDGALLQVDVRSREAVDAAFSKVLELRGGIEVLVNNAGVARDEPFAMMAQSTWDEVLKTNLDGVFHCCRAAVRPMLAKKRGAIVNVASVAGQHAAPMQANYSASKGGVLALTATLGAELAPKGIRVNAVVPGFLDAGMAQRLDHGLAEKIKARVPIGRFGRAEEVAKAVLFLASEDASYVVGQALVVDGGLAL
jgi:3-oxoacyl-[acyl-carrier protein] reductase